MVHEGDLKATDQLAFIQVYQKDGRTSPASLGDIR
jgi:hypothetical protein